MNLIKADYIIGIALILMLFTHGFTQYLIAKYTQTQEIVDAGKAVVALMEQNPLAAQFLHFRKFAYIYSSVIAPGFVLAVYYYMRNRYIEKDVIWLESFSVSVAAIFLINFFNDVSQLLGFLAR